MSRATSADQVSLLSSAWNIRGDLQVRAMCEDAQCDRPERVTACAAGRLTRITLGIRGSNVVNARRGRVGELGAYRMR